jgi:chromosome partitioning protein
MKIVAVASQKGGAGKSTFAVNLAALADLPDAPALLIDTDSQGSLSVWHRLRRAPSPLVVPCRADEIADVLESARRQGIDWVFIDGPPRDDEHIAAMMRLATLVLIPTRPALFDIASVSATIDTARRLKRPFFVALNGVPPKRGVAESAAVVAARKAIRDMGAPLWGGAVAQRAAYGQALAAGQTVAEMGDGQAAAEMRQLWRDVSRATHAMAAYGEAEAVA